MSLVATQIQVKEPDYFHRDYKNDLKIEGSQKTTGTINQGLRVAKAALPFVALYKPVGSALSLVMGGCRAISNASQTYQAYSEGKGRLKIAGEVLHTTVAVIAVGCAFFALPLGMLVTTCHDLAMNCFQLHQAWVEKDLGKAKEAGLQILCNAIYLGLFFTASLEVLVASIAFQVFVGLYQASGEYQKGNYLEVGTGLLMVAVRMNQMAQPVSTIHSKWKAESANKKTINVDAIVNCNTARADLSVSPNSSPELVDIVVKYSNNPEGIPALNYAVKVNDEEAVRVLLENGANINRPSRQGTPLDIALNNGHLRLFSYLMDRNAVPTLHSALICCEKHLLNELAMLLKAKPELVKEDLLILRSCECAFLQGLELLFRNGATLPQNLTSNPDPFLFNLLQRKDPKYLPIVKFMIKQGANCQYKELVTCDAWAEYSIPHPSYKRVGGVRNEECKVHCKVGLINFALDFNDDELVLLLLKNKAHLHREVSIVRDLKWKQDNPTGTFIRLLDSQKIRNLIISSDPLCKALSREKFELVELLMNSDLPRDPWMDREFNNLVYLQSIFERPEKSDYFDKIQKYADLGFLNRSEYFSKMMQYAIKEKNDVHWVSFLFSLGAVYQSQFMNWAVASKNKDIIAFLLARGARIDDV